MRGLARRLDDEAPQIEPFGQAPAATTAASSAPTRASKSSKIFMKSA